MTPSADPYALLDELRHAVAKAVHDVNNPLTVISGNAQLLLEMGRAVGVGEELMGPAEDIEEAAERLAATLAELTALKERIVEATGGTDTLT